MAFSRVFSAQTNLLKGQIISVETDIFRGLNSFSIVGLADKSVDESKDRVNSAIKNSDFISPKNTNQKTIVSLAPADVKKEGTFFDLAIALSYLLSAEKINFDPKDKIFIGELALNGELQKIYGALPITQVAKKEGFTEIYLPEENAIEAALVEGIKIYGVKTLKDLINHLNSGPKNLKLDIEEESIFEIKPQPQTIIERKKIPSFIDFSDIKGQESAKRGMEIAAAGGHNVAMFGPPGTGKTLLARAFSGILPDLDLDDILEITGIHSVVGNLGEDYLITNPPFRSPHHTSSYVSIIGGGTNPKPGEITLAHRGVLFLDEFPEFDKKVIESLRQPLEDHFVNISRAKGSARFPTQFTLVAAMNPCPCGHYGSKQKECVCTASDLTRYRRKLSGPIVDRIDIWLNVENIDYQKLTEKNLGENSAQIKNRVDKAREIQKNRFIKMGKKIKANSEMGVKELDEIILNEETRKILNDGAKKLNLSARGYHRVIKLARTIADIEESEGIEIRHLLEALQYRPKN